MKPRALAVLVLPLFAAACDQVPRSDAPYSVGGGGSDEHGDLWYLAGATQRLVIESSDPELLSWTVVSTDDDVITAATPTPWPYGAGLESRLTSVAPGDAAIEIYDDVDALVTALPIHVRDPESLVLSGVCDGEEEPRLPSVRLLRGSTVPFDIMYLAEQGHSLHGDGRAVVTEGAAQGAAISPAAGRFLELTSSGDPYTAVLAAGEARLEIDVRNVAADQVTLSIDADEGLDPGWAVLRLRGLTSECVYAGPGLWTLDGVPIGAGYATQYLHDPAAEPTELRVTITTPSGDLTATAMVHAAR